MKLRRRWSLVFYTVWAILLGLTVYPTWHYLWLAIFPRGPVVSKVFEDWDRRHTLAIAHTHGADLRGVVAVYLAKGWTVNEAYAQALAEHGLLVDQCLKRGLLARNAEGRYEFRDPWGKPYEFRMMDGYILLMDPEPGSEAAEYAARRAREPGEAGLRRGLRYRDTEWDLEAFIRMDCQDRRDPLSEYLYGRYKTGLLAQRQLDEGERPIEPVPICAIIRSGEGQAVVKLLFLDEESAVTGLVVQGDHGWEGVFPGFVWSEGFRRYYDYTVLRHVDLPLGIGNGPPKGHAATTRQAGVDVPYVWLPKPVLKGKVRVGLVSEDGTRSEMVDAFVVDPAAATKPAK